jgi:hypothetical protein
MLKRVGLENVSPLIIWDLAVLTFTVCTVEMTISMNRIEDVHKIRTSGQMVSLVVGLGSLLTALGELYVGKRQFRCQREE